MSGRLTLTWANKDKALLSHGESGYEWAERDDTRVREVRLLEEIDGGRVGDVTGTAADNLLIRGDSLDALRALVRSPEYAAEYRGKVRLVYIDPPFNTGQAFEHYDDALEHSVWLGMRAGGSVRLPDRRVRPRAEAGFQRDGRLVAAALARRPGVRDAARVR